MPNESGTLPAVNPQGELVNVPAADMPRALKQGFRPPSPEQMAQIQNEEAAQGFGQTLASAAEGAGSALTFGLSPKIETALGITTPEMIAARKEAHPIAHGLGTAAGIIAPLVLSGGAAAPAEAGALGAARTAAGFTAPALIAKAGRAVAGATEGALPGLAGRVLPALAAGATEGGLYAGSDVTEKALLGDPNLTWEKAASEIGMGGLFGGALGAGGKLLGELLPANLGESLADKLGETAGTRNVKAASGPGGSKALINSIQKQVGGKKGLARIGQEMGEHGLVGPLSTPEKTHALAEALKDSAGGEMGSILDAADAAGTGAPTVKDLIGRARKEILGPLKENPLEQGVAKQMEGILDGYEEKLGGADRAVGFRSLHDIRKQVSDKIYGLRGMQDPAGTAFKDSLHDFRSLISDEINQGLDRAGLASDAWKAANRKYQVASVAQRLAEHGILKHDGNNLVSLTEIMAGLTGAASHGLGIGAVSSLGTHFAREHASGILGWAATGAQKRLLLLAGRSDRALSAATSAIFSGARGEAAAGGASKTAERFSDGGLVTPEKYADVSSALRHYGGNLDALAGDVSQQTATLNDHAPGTASAAHAFAARVVSHLGTKLPQDSGPRQLLDPKFEPSRTELAAYNRHHEVAQRGPVAVLEHMARGSLHPDHVEASAAMYPRLHAEAQQLVAERLAEHLAAKKHLPKAVRGPLGMFLGSDLEHATTPGAILSAQLAYQSAPAQQQGKPAGKTRNVDTEFGSRSATGSQGNETRMRKT